MITAIGEVVKKYIKNMILTSDVNFPVWNSENKVFVKSSKWNYIDACIIKALSDYYEINKDNEILEYIKYFSDSYIDNDYKIKTLNPAEYNCDNFNGGKNLLFLYKTTADEKYIKAAEYLISLIKQQPRIKAGNFWHKAIYPYQIWLDGVYMTFPFMAEYGNIKGDNTFNSDIMKQLLNIRKIMRDSDVGLYYHGYDESRASIWCNDKTGLSSNFWLRSNCWLCVALVDLCEITNDKEMYDLCSDMFIELLKALSDCQQNNGMLKQLPVCDHEKNYDETSGTALYAYSAIKASNVNVTDNYIQNGVNAINAITELYVSDTEKDIPTLKNICLVAGLGGESKRDGSVEYYLSEPITENDAKGIAPYIMAYCELKKSKVYNPDKSKIGV